MKEKIEESSPALNEVMGNQLQDSQLQSMDPLNIGQQNIGQLNMGQLNMDRPDNPQVSPLHRHVQILKKEQQLLQQANEEYSPFNVKDQVAKYIHPRINADNKWKRNQVLQVRQLSINDMSKAYSLTGFKFTDSAEKRSKMLLDAICRYKIQTSFKKKIQLVTQNEKKDFGYVNYSLKDAMKLSDEKIVNDYGAKYLDPLVAEYVEVRCNLMKNPFFSVMPIDELKKTPRSELLKKLNKEYSLNEASRAFIVALYEDLIRLQLLESRANEVKKKKPQNPPEVITQKEIKSNRSYKTKIDNEIDSYIHLTDEERAARKEAVNSVMTAGTLWGDRSPAEMDGVSLAKIEGARAILAWMYRNCGAGKEQSKEPFVYTLTQAKPKQLLFMLYLIENGLTKSPNAECFDVALNDYIPDPTAKAFKNKPDWTAISQASNFVMNCKEFNVFLKNDTEEKSLNQTINNYGGLEGDVQNPEKIKAVAKLAVVQVRKLVAMYNAAGLSSDMPANLIADPILKQHVLDTVRQFQRVCNELKKLGGDGEPGQGAGANPIQRDKAPGLENKKTELKTSKNADEIISYVKAGQDIPRSFIKIIGSDVAEFSGKLPYAVSTGGLSILFGAYGLAVKLIDLFSADTKSLSGVEIASQKINLSGGVLKSGADVIKGATDIYKTATGFDPSKFANFGEFIASKGGGLQFGAGTISLVAGGLQTGAGIIDLKQASNSKKHLNNAMNHLQNKTEQDKMEVDGRQEKLTRAEKKQKLQKELQRKEMENLIKHRVDVTKNKKNSAMINMTGGILTMAGGALTMTGLLAPLGGLLSIAGSAISIGLGIIGARIDRNRAICDAVDEGLKLPLLVRKVADRFKINHISGSQGIQLTDRIRQEALAELHYANYKVCYLDMCKRSTMFLYNKVLIKPTTDKAYPKTEEYKMYYEMIMSLGFKRIKRANDQFDTDYPTPEMIYSKLTQGVA
jgi:hypothetical protein